MARGGGMLPVDDEVMDGLTPEEEQALRQAEIGTLFRFQGPAFESVQWTFKRHRTSLEMARDPSGQKMDLLPVTMTGPLNPADVVALIGGGTFNALGYVPRAGGGVKIGYNETFAIAAPRKNFDVADEKASPPTKPDGTQSTPPVDPRVLELERMNRALMRKMVRERREREQEQREERLLEQMRAMIAPLQERLQSPVRQEKPTAIGEMLTVIEGLHRIAGLAGNGSSTEKMMDMALNFFRQGVTIGEGRELPPADGEAREPSWWGPAIDVIRQVLSSRPGAPPPPPPPSGHPRSSATVVEQPPPPGTPGAPSTTPPPAPNPPPPPAAPAEDLTRWRAVVDAAARAVESGEDPVDFAASVTHILDRDELSNLTGSQAEDGWHPNVEELLVYINIKLGSFPQLNSAGGRRFLDRVLDELRAPEEAESESPE